jgi:hypothetical protein
MKSPSARLELTAHKFNKTSGSATITHPFHPLHGKNFPILSSKKVGDKDILSLAVSIHGALAIPREWTDRAVPNPYESLYSNSILSVVHLEKLTKLITELNGKD